MKKSLKIACVGLLLSTVFSAPVMASTLKKVKMTIPRNSVWVLSVNGGKEAGIFSKHGIDLEIDLRPFKGHMAGLPAKEVPVTTYAGTAAIARINQGLDWVIIGGGLTVMQEVFVRKDSPIKTVADLKGKKFGAWSTGAGAFKAVRATIIDGFGLDVLKDTEFVQAAPPVLFKLLEKGQVDAMFNISSLTIAAASRPTKYRSIFSPNEYWTKKTGHPIVWSGPLVAWRSWVDEDRDRAKRFVAAFAESMEWVRNGKNLDAVVKKYGKLAAVKNAREAKTYKEWFTNHRIFLTEWNEEVVTSQWKFLDMAKQRGILTKVPPKEKYGLVLK